MVSSRTASAPPQKKCKKKGLPHYFNATAPLFIVWGPARIPLAGRPWWRLDAGKTLCHRRATPTGRSESCLPGAHVGAAPSTKPYPTVGPRQQAGPNPARQPPMLAPRRRQNLMPPSGHANRPAQILFYTEIYKPTIFCLHLDRYGLKNSLPIKTVLKGNFFYEIIVLSMESCNI